MSKCHMKPVRTGAALASHDVHTTPDRGRRQFQIWGVSLGRLSHLQPFGHIRTYPLQSIAISIATHSHKSVNTCEHLSDFLRQETLPKFDIVVSEVMDLWCLGEGIIPTMRHAHKKLGWRRLYAKTKHRKLMLNHTFRWGGYMKQRVSNCYCKETNDASN